MSLIRQFAPALAALASLVLMGIAGFGLLFRLARLLRGQDKTAVLPVIRRLPVRGMLWAAGAMLLSRMLLILLAYALYRVLGFGTDGIVKSYEGLWMHWDVRHYVAIAQQGYVPAGDERLRLVFFPMYPLLMWLGGFLTGGDVFLSGTILSIVCACLSAALVYVLASACLGEKRAKETAAFFILNPMSVFLSCCYTEALFICLTLAAAVLIMRGHPWLAALCGAASAFTRMPGVIVSGLFLIGLLSEIPRGTFSARSVFRCLALMAVVFSGLVLYWEVNRRVSGNPFMYLTYQRENWFQQPGTFWDSTANTMDYFLDTYGDEDWLWTWGFQLFAMFFGYGLLAAQQKKLPFSLAAYSFVYIAVVFAPTWLLSGARYLYGLITLSLLQASCGSEKFKKAMLAGSGLLLPLFLFGYTLAVTVL